MRFTSTGLAVSHPEAPLSALEFVDAVLRGIGQVMLRNNSYAGALFLLGIAWNAPLLAWAAVLGTAVSTATALLLQADRAMVRDGMYGFNGALAAIALLVFLKPSPLAWGCVVFAAAGSTIAMAALVQLLKVWSTPALTAPFVWISWCFFLATARLGRLEPTGLLPAANLPKAAAVEGIVTSATVLDGLFHGVAQVFFQESVVTGAIFLIALFVSSRIVGAAAVAGSLAGLLVAWGMGAPETGIRAGLFGFNSVLVAIALGGVFFQPGRASAVYALLAAAVTPLVAAAISAAVQPFGLPGLTMPFVLVTWLFLWAGGAFPVLSTAEGAEN
ncbi:MAG: urea transporter [Bryobacterales bacterium]|nr:urea transporter [Bryobacterales bacterium]